MIFEHRRKVSNKDKRSADKKMAKKKKEEQFYLGDLTEEEMGMMDVIHKISPDSAEKVANVLNDSAELAGREVTREIKLLPAQVIATVASFINPRFFIGDEPGLGKTVMSAASYAFYRLKKIKAGKPYKKVIVATESAHVESFAQEWTSYGIKMIAMNGTEKQFYDEIEEDDFDGIVSTWDGLKTNKFLKHYLPNEENYDFIVCDETSRLRNPKSSTYKTVDSLLNTYGSGMERVLFLNGTSFEKNIYDFYYQFNVLKPKIIRSKSWINKRYVVKENDAVWRKDWKGNARKFRFGKVVDYKNQEELKERLKYYFIARSKEDYTKEPLPEHEYNLHMVDMTEDQKRWLEEVNYVSVINSPSTSLGDEGIKTNAETSPKIRHVVDHMVKHAEDRPLVYVYNHDSIRAVKEELVNKGYRVAVLNGETKDVDKAQIVKDFNKEEYDMLVLNVGKAISLPTSDRVVFYDIPTMPSTTSQVSARIDRNNYTKVKHYDFFCYNESPEMINLARLGYFREKHAGLFTGQKTDIYSTLIDQLGEYLTEEQSKGLADTFETMYQDRKDFDDVKDKVHDLLDIN